MALVEGVALDVTSFKKVASRYPLDSARRCGPAHIQARQVLARNRCTFRRISHYKLLRPVWLGRQEWLLKNMVKCFVAVDRVVDTYFL